MNEEKNLENLQYSKVEKIFNSFYEEFFTRFYKQEKLTEEKNIEIIEVITKSLSVIEENAQITKKSLNRVRESADVTCTSLNIIRESAENQTNTLKTFLKESEIFLNLVEIEKSKKLLNLTNWIQEFLDLIPENLNLTNWIQEFSNSISEFLNLVEKIPNLIPERLENEKIAEILKELDEISFSRHIRYQDKKEGREQYIRKLIQFPNNLNNKTDKLLEYYIINSNEMHCKINEWKEDWEKNLIEWKEWKENLISENNKEFKDIRNKIYTISSFFLILIIFIEIKKTIRRNND